MGAARTPSRERGAAAVLTTVLAGLLMVLAVLLSAVGGMVADQRRAASAADLAALAGAAALQHGHPGCTVAAQVARANEATLLGCRESGRVLTVRVGRDPRGVTARLLGRVVGVTSRARAGPVDGEPSR
jgi:secretion/DNA translocation related TadE-like protein